MSDHLNFPIMCSCGYMTTTNGPRICPECGGSVCITYVEEVNEENEKNANKNI